MEFERFIKEGLSYDVENADALFKLVRFNTTFSGNEIVSLDEYITKMK